MGGGFYIIWSNKVRLGFKVSEPIMFPILWEDNNKVDYTSSEKMAKYEGQACINDQSFPDKTNQVVRDYTGFQ